MSVMHVCQGSFWPHVHRVWCPLNKGLWWTHNVWELSQTKSEHKVSVWCLQLNKREHWQPWEATLSFQTRIREMQKGGKSILRNMNDWWTLPRPSLLTVFPWISELLYCPWQGSQGQYNRAGKDVETQSHLLSVLVYSSGSQREKVLVECASIRKWNKNSSVRALFTEIEQS